MDYIVYAKYKGCKNFAAFDLENGCKAGNIIFASTYSKINFEHAQKVLQEVAEENTSIHLTFQLRTPKGHIAWESK